MWRRQERLHPHQRQRHQDFIYQCTNCLCEESTCIFTLMSTVVDSKVYGRHDTTSVGGLLEHEHIVSVATHWYSFS
jgi:hypothetical protein